MHLNSLLILFFAAAILLFAQSASAETDVLRNQVKVWTYQATASALNLDQTHYNQKIAALRFSLFTKDGCDTFITALNNYDLYDQIHEYRNILTASLWERKMMREPIDQIIIAEEKYDKDKGRYKWKVEVPLKIKNSNRKTSRLYNFLAVVTVLQTNNPQKPFIIDRWHTVISKRDDIGRGATNYNPKKQNKSWPECKA